jgi:hypothetical protein
MHMKRFSLHLRFPVSDLFPDMCFTWAELRAAREYRCYPLSINRSREHWAQHENSMGCVCVARFSLEPNAADFDLHVSHWRHFLLRQRFR